MITKFDIGQEVCLAYAKGVAGVVTSIFIDARGAFYKMDTPGFTTLGTPERYLEAVEEEDGADTGNE